MGNKENNLSKKLAHKYDKYSYSYNQAYAFKISI